jgi:type I restriction enzyme, S subunit
MSSNFVTFNQPDRDLGGLSNLNPDYPIAINGIRLPTAEHLFRGLRYRSAMIQAATISIENPVSAQRFAASKEFREQTCDIWQKNQLEVMEFCLIAKLLWNWVKFGRLLRSTEGKAIYMLSTRGKYWGVTACSDGFVGENHMGRLLMKLRDELLSENNEYLRILTPPPHLDLKFLGQSIRTKDRRDHLRQTGTRTTEMVNALRP